MSDPFKDALRKDSQKLNCCCDTGLVCPTHGAMGKTSDTPDVDARQRIVLGGVGGDWKVVDADFARRLAVERNSLQEIIRSNWPPEEAEELINSCKPK